MNSVSFIDGKKYHNGKEEIALVRQTSDRICWENYLSVVTTPNAEKSKEYWQKSIDNFNRKDEKMKNIIEYMAM